MPTFTLVLPQMMKHKPRISKAPIFYIPSSYKDSRKFLVCCRVLSKKELEALSEYNSDHEVQAETAYLVYSMAINYVEDEQGNRLTYDDLPYSVCVEIAKFILQESVITPEEYEKLELNIRLHFSDELKSDNWNCEVCRSKRLDRVRNCGFRGELDKSKDFKVQIGEHIYTHCPIYDIDKELIAAAIESYNIFSSGFLPDSGGLYDQTQFFITSATLVDRAYKKQQEKEMKEELSKMKKQRG